MWRYFHWNRTVSWCTIPPPPNVTPAVYPLRNIYCRHIVKDAVWQSLIEDTDFRLHTVYSSFPVSDNGLKVISVETRKDAELTVLRNSVKCWMEDVRRYPQSTAESWNHAVSNKWHSVWWWKDHHSCFTTYTGHMDIIKSIQRHWLIYCLA